MLCGIERKGFGPIADQFWISSVWACGFGLFEQALGINQHTISSGVVQRFWLTLVPYICII